MRTLLLHICHILLLFHFACTVCRSLFRSLVLAQTTQSSQPPFLDKISYLFYRSFLLFLNRTLTLIRYMCIALENWLNFTGFDLKSKRFSIHWCTWATQELMCALYYYARLHLKYEIIVSVASCVIVMKQIDRTESNGINLHAAIFCHIGMIFYV